MITGAAFILRWSCWLLQNSLFCESWPCLLLAWLIVWSVQSMGGVSQLPLNRLLRLSDTEMAAIVRLTTTQRKSLNCDNYHYSALFLWGTVYQLLRTSKSEGRNYLEDEILSIFVWELVIGPSYFGTSRSQPSGPLCLWQCFKTEKEFNLPFSVQNCNILIIREDSPIPYYVIHGQPLMAAQHSTVWEEKGWIKFWTPPHSFTKWV